jgi:hypothetical protein
MEENASIAHCEHFIAVLTVPRLLVQLAPGIHRDVSITPRLPEQTGQVAQAGRFPACDFCSTFLKKWKKKKPCIDFNFQTVVT